MKRLVFLFVCSLCLNGDSARAGWGNGDCAPVGAPVANERLCNDPVPSGNPFRWERSATDPDCWGLRFNGVQVGGWRESTGVYRPLAGGQWGDACSLPYGVSPPVKVAKAKHECRCCGEDCRCADGRPCGKPDCPCILPGATVESDGSLNFGVTTSRIPHRPRRIHNGEEVSKERLLQAIGEPTIRDDSGELSVTVIGSDAERQPVLSDLSSNATLAPFKGKLKIQGYAPDHWAVKGAGFATNGHPTIYCQAPDGKVLHRQDEYRGAEALAEALRQADANYTGKSDPDLNKPAGLSLPSLAEVEKWLADVPGLVWCVLAFVVYLRFFHKENG